MVFYRKYRPQTLEELAGQTVVKQSLQASLAAGKLAHAYLFCGPKGTGKTSTARILAKIVNCENPVSVSIPCNKCPHCRSITDGSNMDVVEMDAASNRGIEDIRSLRENIKLSPSAAKKKVYIIDEVHMLSGDAFNALLKTLEEPPGHVLFVLATTEVQKIPATILSRVIRLDFQPVGVSEMVEVLRKIAGKEKIIVDDEALHLLAQRSGGGIRDGVKLLDQLSAQGKIDRKVVEENLGSGRLEELVKLLESITAKDLSGALKKLSSLVEVGVNPKELNLSVLEILRRLLMVKNGLETDPELRDLAASLIVPEILRVMEAFQKSLEQSRFVSIPTLPLEMAVVESATGGSDKSECLSISEPEKSVGQKSKEPVSADTPTHVKADLPASPGLSDSPDIRKIQERWMYILETVRQYNYSLEALLRSAKVLGCSEGSVILEVPYSFHQRILEAPKSRDILQSILSDILGRSIGISTVLGQRPPQSEEIANIEVAADDEIVRIASEIFNSEPVN